MASSLRFSESLRRIIFLEHLDDRHPQRPLDRHLHDGTIRGCNMLGDDGNIGKCVKGLALICQRHDLCADLQKTVDNVKNVPVIDAEADYIEHIIR